MSFWLVRSWGAHYAYESPRKDRSLRMCGDRERERKRERGGESAKAGFVFGGFLPGKRGTGCEIMFYLKATCVCVCVWAQCGWSFIFISTVVNLFAIPVIIKVCLFCTRRCIYDIRLFLLSSRLIFSSMFFFFTSCPTGKMKMLVDAFSNKWILYSICKVGLLDSEANKVKFQMIKLVWRQSRWKTNKKNRKGRPMTMLYYEIEFLIINNITPKLCLPSSSLQLEKWTVMTQHSCFNFTCFLCLTGH